MSTARIVTNNVACLYSDPSLASELVSQVVYGHAVEIIEASGSFSRVICEDRYEGWALSQWLAPPEPLDDYLHTTIASTIAPIVTAPSHSARIATRLTAGAKVVVDHGPVRSDYARVRVHGFESSYVHVSHLSSTYFGKKKFEMPTSGHMGAGELRSIIIDALVSSVCFDAVQLIGTPYLWGGSTPFGLDCSGFTQLVYRLNGVLLLRDASLQIDDRRFEKVGDAAQLSDAHAFNPGDLLFFGSRSEAGERKVAHVGIALGDDTFIHSAGMNRGVIVTPLDDEEFGAIYLGARRLSPNAELSINSA
jgi:cell wall-associated NlpC family hydrolase